MVRLLVEVGFLSYPPSFLGFFWVYFVCLFIYVGIGIIFIVFVVGLFFIKVYIFDPLCLLKYFIRS